MKIKKRFKEAVPNWYAIKVAGGDMQKAQDLADAEYNIKVYLPEKRALEMFKKAFDIE